MSITLESVLHNRDEHYNQFIDYMKCTYCYENIQFWQAVQCYKANPAMCLYKKIVEDHIYPNAPFEINIPCEIRREIIYSEPNEAIFDKAADAILELIRNSFIPWHLSVDQKKSMRVKRRSLSWFSRKNNSSTVFFSSQKD